MRKFLPIILLVFVCSAAGQNIVPAPEATRSEFLNQKFWSELGKPVEGDRGFQLFTRNMQPKSDTLFEFWVKVVPTNALLFNKRYDLPRDAAYAVQFATVDCSKRLVTTEKTKVYAKGNEAVDAKNSEIVKNESRSRVRSGSINETIFQYICLKLE